MDGHTHEIQHFSPVAGRSADHVGRSFFDGNQAITILRDSAELGWQGAYAAATRERPYEALRPPIPAVWLATALNRTSLRRIIRGREMYDPAIPSDMVVITPPSEGVRDVVGLTADALHVFLSNTLLDEVAAETFCGRIKDTAVSPAFCIRDPVMMPLLHVVRRTLEEPPYDARLKADYLIRALAAHVLSVGHKTGPVQPASELAARQMRLLRDYIESHLADEIAIADLANLVGVSRTQFLRRFKTSSGTSPYQYVMEIRVDRAKELLSTSKMSLTEITAICGFASQAHLAAVFQRFVKMPPAAFRRQF